MMPAEARGREGVSCRHSNQPLLHVLILPHAKRAQDLSARHLPCRAAPRRAVPYHTADSVQLLRSICAWTTYMRGLPPYLWRARARAARAGPAPP